MKLRAGRPGIVRERFAALFLLGFLLLNPPILAIFNIELFVFGIPLLYAYLFGVWLALIALVAVAIERTGGDGMPPEPAPTGEARREG